MSKQLTIVLAFIVLGAAAIGYSGMYQMDDLELKNQIDVLSNGKEQPSEADLVIDFEEGIPKDLGMWDVCCDDSIELVSDHVRGGNRAARMKLSPQHNFSRVQNVYPTRNEVTPARDMEQKMEKHNISTKDEESWYGFSIKPKENLYLSPLFEVVFQAHHVNDECDTFGGNPPIAIYVIEDEYIVQNVGDNDRCQKDWNQVDREGRERWHFPLNRGEWTDWVIYTNWKHTDEGVFKVWRNGEKVIERRNEPVTYNDEKVLRFRFGPYKSVWMDHPRESNRTYYYDEFRGSGSNGSYRQVAPR